MNTVQTRENILSDISEKDQEDCKNRKYNTTINLHFSAYRHALVLMDRYLVSVISHIANIWSCQTKARGKNIQDNQERQTACSGVYGKYTDMLVGLEPVRRHLLPHSKPIQMSLLRLPTRWQTSVVEPTSPSFVPHWLFVESLKDKIPFSKLPSFFTNVCI